MRNLRDVPMHVDGARCRGSRLLAERCHSPGCGAGSGRRSHARSRHTGAVLCHVRLLAREIGSVTLNPVGTGRSDMRRAGRPGSGSSIGQKVDFVRGIAENSPIRASSSALLEPGFFFVAEPRVEVEAIASRPSHSRGPRMPANWITERPTHRRRVPRPIEAPRLELPLHQPAFERAKPRPEDEDAQSRAERGSVVVDFYI